MKKTFVLFAVTLTAAAQLLKSEAAATTRLKRFLLILNCWGIPAGAIL